MVLLNNELWSYDLHRILYHEVAHTLGHGEEEAMRWEKCVR